MQDLVTERLTIKNRHGLNLVIQVDTPELPKELVFIAHGQGGFMKQMHISAYADAFLQNGFRVIRFDATHSLGESEGDIIDVTYDSYVQDLEDVIEWAREQEWFQIPFSLCGHSMGAQSTCWYAENHPEEIKYLAPMAPTVNYELWEKTWDPEFKRRWQERGYKEEPSRSKPGVIARVGWGVAESLKRFDLLPKAGNLTMPVLFMAGDHDQPCPYKNQIKLFELIPSKDKTFIKIANAEHSLRNYETGEYGEELQEARAEMDAWLKKLTSA